MKVSKNLERTFFFFGVLVFWATGASKAREGPKTNEENRMKLRLRLSPFYEDLENDKAFSFLKSAIADMYSGGVSNVEDVAILLGWDNSYLLSCTNDADEVCGIFQIHLATWRNDCFVNTAYTHADYRRQGVFNTLFAFTNERLAAIIGAEFDTISFGVFDSNKRMRSVMRKSGCLPVELYDDVEATVWSFPRNAEAAERLHHAAALLEANLAQTLLPV